MKIGIVGAGGCFAQNFVRHLDSLGIECFGVGRSFKKPPFWLVPRAFRYHKLNLVTQLPALMAVLDTERPDVVVQFAAQGEGAASFGEHAPDFFTTNCVGLIRLVLELEKRSYLRRFIQIGSSEVYGSPETPAKETDPLKPTSPYSISKAAFDQYLDSMWRTSKFPMNIVRPSNCYTEGQQLHRIIPKTILCALKGEKLKLHGGGRAMKSYLHSTDLSKALMRIMEAPLGTTYNVGPDEPISIREVVSEVIRACGKRFEDLVQDVPDRMGQDAKYHLDCSAIKSLGWKQEIGLRDGIYRMVDWINSYSELLSMETQYKHAA